MVIEHEQKCVSLSENIVIESPALQKMSKKYLFPMRDSNTQVFFDNSADEQHTLLFVFAEDRHGLILDVQSVLKALKVHTLRLASGNNQALQLVLARCEGELRSIQGLGLNLQNCTAFWVQDLETCSKLYNAERLDQLTTCIKFELQNAHPRPRPKDESDWHRVVIEKNHFDRFTAFSVQTRDRTGLLAGLTSAFASLSIDVASATIGSFDGRAENIFMVTKRGFKEPLKDEDIYAGLEQVMRSLVQVAQLKFAESLWYQTREGRSVLVSEALFVDEVNNAELSGFSKHETPNFRGRLPCTPYKHVE